MGLLLCGDNLCHFLSALHDGGGGDWGDGGDVDSRNAIIL